MKKLACPVNKVNAPVMGLDVHQRLIAYVLLDARGVVQEAGEIGSSPEVLIELFDRLIGSQPAHAAFEAGGSTQWVFDTLVSRLGAAQVHVAQPKKIRAIANSSQKSDLNDAWWLAYLTHEGRLPQCYIPTGRLRELRIATRERVELVKLRTRTIVNLRAGLRQMGVKLPTQKVTGPMSWNALIALAQSRPGARGLVLQQQLERIEHLEAAIEEMEALIEELCASMPQVHALRRHIPGVGKVLAATLAAELGPVQRFHSAKALGRYSGLTPAQRSSGGVTRRGAISREGASNLRWALTQAAMGCLRSRSGPGLAAGNWIRAKERRMGSKGKARAAAARKIAESIWRLFHWGECFDAAKPFGGLAAAA